MLTDHDQIDVETEGKALMDCLRRGDPRASVHLARLFTADRAGALQPFAEALAGRLSDHLSREAESGRTDSWETLSDQVYELMQSASIDWSGIPGKGRPGEEA